jgi:carboxymethylenebutenolidase
MGTTIELTASDGHRLAAYRADPSGKARGAIVVVQEIFGVNSHIRSVADGYAADGYATIAPALFDRAERNVDIGYSPAEIARGREIRSKIDNHQAMQDVSAALKAVSGAGKVGIVGYCWGGLIAWLASANVPGLACAVPYYGGGMPDHIGIAPRCPVMAHFGERDQHIALEGVRKLATAHPQHIVHIYAADHGFNCDQRGSYDAAAAKLARSRTLDFFRQYVG